ncbi:MAG: ATP cone domain-containing protein [Candidatus Aenigmarchaeota archaeon]|nr:ATP cone domain-containing protein [Candidatus Aenigmarchaeota archaeon]
MTVVIKRDNRKEDFSRDKIRRSVENAAKRVKLDSSRSRDIADRIARNVEEHFKSRDEIRASDIRDRVLSELNREEKRISKEFGSFRKELR